MAKKPRWEKGPNPAKIPKHGQAEENANQQRFCWRCDHIYLDGEWGFQHAECRQLWGEVIPRLHALEAMTWAEIYARRDTSTHPMPVDKIEASARARLAEKGLGDQEGLFQINVRGGIRLWGVRDRAILYLLWFDPNHTVYIQRD